MTVGNEQIVGIDSLVPSSAAALGNAQSNTYLGQPPAFWGRYFYAPGQINSSGKKDTHYSAKENAFLRASNIRLLPVARQTGNVGDPNKAAADAKNNVDAIFECLPVNYLAGADPSALVFLDVESDRPLVAGYYKAWAETLAQYSQQVSQGRVRLLPAIYAGPLDKQTWTALKAALGGGSACYGAWMARYYYGSPVPRPWEDDLVTPQGGVQPPILAWQYWASPDQATPPFNFDTSLASPAHSDVLLNGLIMPPTS